MTKNLLVSKYVSGEGSDLHSLHGTCTIRSLVSVRPTCSHWLNKGKKMSRKWFNSRLVTFINDCNSMWQHMCVCMHINECVCVNVLRIVQANMIQNNRHRCYQSLWTIFYQRQIHSYQLATLLLAIYSKLMYYHSKIVNIIQSPTCTHSNSIFNHLPFPEAFFVLYPKNDSWLLISSFINSCKTWVGQLCGTKLIKVRFI